MRTWLTAKSALAYCILVLNYYCEIVYCEAQAVVNEQGNHQANNFSLPEDIIKDWNTIHQNSYEKLKNKYIRVMLLLQIVKFKKF